jgi:hypothetical protein
MLAKPLSGLAFPAKHNKASALLGSNCRLTSSMHASQQCRSHAGTMFRLSVILNDEILFRRCARDVSHVYKAEDMRD